MDTIADNPKRKGSITELIVIAKLMEYGEVSIPYGNNARYDCILDINNTLIRIQIKTANVLDENRFTVPFANKRSNAGGNVRKVYTSEEVDYIATYHQDELYLFETGTHTNSMTISFNYPSNGLKNKINLAENYKASKILEQYQILE